MKKFAFLFAALILTVACGCGNQNPPPIQTVSVKGKITLNGSPMAGGRVLFVPKELGKGLETFAEVKNGEFEVKQGMVPATYKVYVDPVSYRNGKPFQAMRKGAIPQKYLDPATTTSEVQVAASPSDLKINLN